MNQHKFVVEIERNLQVVLLDVLVSIKKDIMSIFVVSKLLFLLRNIDSNLYCLLHISYSSVEFKSPLWLLWNVISLSHQVVDQLMSQCIYLDLADHLNHVRNLRLSFMNEELKSLLILLTLFIMLGSIAPLTLSLKVLSNLQVLLSVLVINFQNNFCVLVHFLMRLSNNERFFSLSRKNQELNSFFLCSICLTPFSDHLGTLCSLSFISENMLGFIWVVQLLKV
jgi:hypothetical protein